MELNEQELIRRQKLDELRNNGFDPFPAEKWEINTNALAILNGFDNQSDDFKDLSHAGRIMSIRDMGKALFIVVQDAVGRIQLYVRRDDICPDEDKKLFDLVVKKSLEIGRAHV